MASWKVYLSVNNQLKIKKIDLIIKMSGSSFDFRILKKNSKYFLMYIRKCIEKL